MMRHLSMVLLIFSMSLAIPAAAQARDYRSLIQQAWPDHQLRNDQLDWVAKASERAHQQCRQGGFSADYCDEMIIQALREQMGSEPRQAALWATRHSVK